ncbi:26S proteasome subunit RPN7 [Coniochaeta sp. 2T2.1]|nr:26S proteasome subunit RPN7 [Coniochaeta sp. 2T2.1]
MGHEDLGKHYESIGELSKAFDAYSHMRPDISAPRHIVDIAKHLANISLQRRDWVMVATNLNKLMGFQDGEEEKNFQPYQKIAMGIGLLGQSKYQDAAQSFLEADTTIPSTMYSDVASPNDVAVYACLLALATMDRNDLKKKVLENTNFKTFLQLEPHLRKAVSQFVIGRYSACLAILESYRPDYLLDIYLQKHVAKIFADIREKCIVSYMVPFSRVALAGMNAAFGSPGKPIEPELADMIRSGKLKARINKIDGIVTVVPSKPRSELQKGGLEKARSYEMEAVERIRRMSLLAADLEVKGNRRQNLGGGLHQQALPGETSEMAFDPPSV